MTYSMFSVGVDENGRRRGRVRGDAPMNTGSVPRIAQPTPSVTCRVCGTVVPLGAFCGSCGAHLSPQRGNGPDWLRIRAYGAAPGEHLLRLSVVSSLFPHLPHRSRTAFRLVLAALVVVLVLVALLHWQAALIALSALGFPLLFQIYLQESDVYHDLPVRALLVAAVTGAAFGLGWAVLTGPLFARSDTAALGVSGQVVLRDGLAIPLGGAVLMLVPAVLVRLLRPPTRESLDGYVIGSLGAIAYTAASVLTRLAPQLATGLVARDRPVGSLLVEAGIQGVAMPLTAAAAGGLVGAALWYTGRADPARGGLRWAALAPAVAAVLAVYAAMGLVDVARLPQGMQLALHLVIAVLAILVLRICLHAALLHEAHEVMQGGPLLCAHCHHVVPDMAFCANCGVAIQASARHSREARRLSRPTPTDTTPETAPAAAPSVPVWTGYAVPDASYTAPAVRHTSYTRLFVILGAALVVVVAAVVAVAWFITPPPPARSTCPPDCGGPPTGPSAGPPPVSVGARPPAGAPAPPPGPPVHGRRFTSDNGGFSVAYPDGAKPAPNVTGLVLGDENNGVWLFGTSAAGRTPGQIAQTLIQDNWPGATMAYQIPNAMVGYQRGYGEIDDYYPVSGFGSSQHLRVLVMVAEKNGLALIAMARGPYAPHTGDHPSGAGLRIAGLLGYLANSFTWKGDPLR